MTFQHGDHDPGQTWLSSGSSERSRPDGDSTVNKQRPGGGQTEWVSDAGQAVEGLQHPSRIPLAGQCATDKDNHGTVTDVIMLISQQDPEAGED